MQPAEYIPSSLIDNLWLFCICLWDKQMLNSATLISHECRSLRCKLWLWQWAVGVAAQVKGDDQGSCFSCPSIYNRSMCDHTASVRIWYDTVHVYWTYMICYKKAILSGHFLSDVALNMTAHVTLQRLPVQSGWPFLSLKKQRHLSEWWAAQNYATAKFSPFSWAIFHLTYFMSVSVLLCINHD